jgi:hypothetical protein
MSVLESIERTLLTLWVGGMWVTGFVVAPVLFDQLERAQAGTVAGVLFGIVAWIGLGCGLVLLSARFYRIGLRFDRVVALVFAMLAITAVGEFVLAPMIAALRESGAVDTGAFRRLHGAASVLYLVNSLLGLVLVAGRRA